MTKKELSQLRYLDWEITRLEEKLADLEESAHSIGSALSDAPKSPGRSDRVGDLATQIADLKALINLNIQKRWYERNQLMRYIMSVDDSLMRQILTCRYVDGMNWTQVAMKVGGGNTPDSIRMAVDRFLLAN